MADDEREPVAASALVARVDRIAHRARERDIERRVARGGAAVTLDFSEPTPHEPPSA